MKKIITILLVLFVFSGYSQNEIPVHKYYSSSLYKTPNEFVNSIFLLGGYPYTNFLNKRFNDNLNNENLTRDFCFFLGLEGSSKYFKWSVGTSISTFKVADTFHYTKAQDDEEDLSINTSSYNAKLDLMLLPQVSFMSLFIGGGVEYYLIDANTEEKAEKSFLNPIWEVGIDIFITKNLKIYASYVQSIDNKNSNASSSINGGIGYSIFNY